MSIINEQLSKVNYYNNAESKNLSRPLLFPMPYKAQGGGGQCVGRLGHKIGRGMMVVIIFQRLL